ncbi:unnamed protein product [Hydatigera taeniaeformis]|uniref:EGF-like domain-containing protein n=1 Tax=Hydatigena taeniaeformis TaxID=6205 RepID=A0A158REJ3_HYDTA|nr:unnamed protein product [Hydatigera taeniaeformis]
MKEVLKFQRFLILMLFSIPSCLSTPGLFNFSQENAFIEIDTQPFSCSRDIQKLFSISFDIHLRTNSSILFTGISASLAPETTSEDALKNLDAPGLHGAPLALFIYTERPYFRLMVMRLTDYQVRFYLHHAFGYFDRSWRDWHRVEVIFTRAGSTRTEIRFKVDQKTNRGMLHTGDILWPDWAELKSKAASEKTTKRKFYSNEAFLGFPPTGTMARFATDTLIKYHDDIRSVFVGASETNGYEGSHVPKFGPFRGAMKSFLIASECACGMISAFGPRIVQIGSGIEFQSVCDVSAVPPLGANISGLCRSNVSGLPCGCVGSGNWLKCYCPLERHCSALKPIDFKSTRVGLLLNGSTVPDLSKEADTLVLYEQRRPLKFLAEGPHTYNQMDSCFSNIFLCKKDIYYKFWMRVDPTALMNGSTMVIKHASHLKSPWHMQVSYKGLPKRIADPEHIMKIAVEIQAPPHFTWNIDGCSNKVRVVLGQWHQITIRWDRKNLTLFVDENLCCIASQRTQVIIPKADQRFGSRRTPFLFIGNHRVQDLIFNDVGLLPSFFRLTKLANNHGELSVNAIVNRGDFYSVFRLDRLKPFSSVQLPGVNVTVVGVDERLAVLSRRQDCNVFRLPVGCVTSDSCSVEVERRDSNIIVHSWNVQLNTETDSELCNIARQQISHDGLVPNSQMLLFNRRRSELLRRRLIQTTHFPNLRCNFDHLQPSSRSMPLDLTGLCEMTEAFPNYRVQSKGDFTKSPVDGTLEISMNQLVLHPLSTNLESYCLQDLEICQFGLTMSFWMLPLTATRAPKVWTIVRQNGLSGSQISVDLVQTDNQYNLEAKVKSMQTISSGKATSKIWTTKATSTYDSVYHQKRAKISTADGLWTLVIVSWSHVAGLSVKLNDTLVSAARESYEEISSWPTPVEPGLWFGHREAHTMGEAVIIDDFQFIPAELNHLAFVNQKIDVELSNQGLRLCSYATCLDASSCHSFRSNNFVREEFCRCENPHRVCKEALVASRTPKVLIVPKASPTPPSWSPLSQARSWPASSSPPPKTTTTVQPTIKPIISVSETTTAVNHSQTKYTGTAKSRSLAPQSPLQRDTVSSMPSCNPPCQNGGKCVFSTINGDFTCDCSETPFWGSDCSREHVGWLAHDSGVPDVDSKQRLFAIYRTMNGSTKQRFIFRTQASNKLDPIPRRPTRRSISQPSASGRMALLTVKNDTFAFRLVLINRDLYLVTEGDTTSLFRLIPCAQSTSLKLNDGALHAIEVEHHQTFLRAKVDGVPVYPVKAVSRSCDKWFFFSIVKSMNNRLYAKKMISMSGEANPSLVNAFLGSWSDGKEEFKGAIGGWMVDDEEMIMPVTVEPKDTPNTVYHLNRRFGLSNGDFDWRRLNSLIPVTVLIDGVVTKTSPGFSNTVWFWIVGCISLGLPLLLFVCWACARLHSQRKAGRKGVWHRSYPLFKPMKAKLPSPASRISSNSSMHPLKSKDEASSTLTNGSYVSPKLRRLKAYTAPCNDSSALTTDSLWRARVLTLQPSMKLGSIVSSSSPTATSTTSLCPFDETDDVEEIFVTPNGDSVITLATNHGTSIKQWNTSDGSCQREILFRPKGQSETRTFGIMSLHEKIGLLLADEKNIAHLHPLSADLPSATVQLPSTVWGVFPIGDLALFVTSTAGATNDVFASLHFWSPSSKALVVESQLRAKPSWQKKGFLPQDAKRLQPLLGPNQANLLLRWLCPSSEDYSFSITVNLSTVYGELKFNMEPLVSLDPHISTILVRHSMNLHETTFLTAEIAVTGDSRGTLHIWDVQTGTTYRSVQSDPIPIDGPLLKNLVHYDFSRLNVSAKAGPITALAATEPHPTEGGSFTWFCSGDDSGCVVVRRCVATTSGAARNVATRIHAKFRPYSQTHLTYSADSVTCASLLSRSQWRKKKPEAFLATGDLSGCIRVWLLPQCTQLAQLSASCEFGLRDLVLTQSSPSMTLPDQWLQVVGLVRREKCVSSRYEQGHVVIIHLSAREENGVPNAMHSPRIRIVYKS